MRSGSAPVARILNHQDGLTSTAIVVAGDEQSRVLFRGLLRLHHVWVDGEAEGETRAIELIRTHRPSLLVVDAILTDGSLTRLIGQARALVPGLRVILTVPAPSSPHLSTNPSERPDVVLLRPFRMFQFAEAVAPPADSKRSSLL